MSSKPPDFRSRSVPGPFDPDKIPDEFDLDPRFGDPRIPGKYFQILTANDCPGSEFCPRTNHACYGGTEVDTFNGPTCRPPCGETRLNTCYHKFCVDTLGHKGCGGTVITARRSITCLHTCFNTCGCPPPTGTCICG